MGLGLGLGSQVKDYQVVRFWCSSEVIMSSGLGYQVRGNHEVSHSLVKAALVVLR